jgi:type IV fimbrial biogenesis protein FimT
MMLRKRIAGFTLLELLITVTVLGVLLAWAVPSFRTFLLNGRLTTQVNSYVAALQTARTEAVKRGIPVTICASTDADQGDNATCSGNAADWDQGWIVFADFDGDNVVDAGDNDTIVKVDTVPEGGNTMVVTASAIEYRSSGMLDSAADITFTVTREECSGNGVRVLTITPQGRVSVTVQSCP